jgi:hypothetical protein
VARDVAVVAAAYFPGTGDPVAADAAVERLERRLGPGEDTVARICLLVQACVPTAALVASAAALAGQEPGGRVSPDDAGAVDALVERALRERPPVPATRRWRADVGEVLVPLDATPFGAGPRRCPAEPHARALTAGILAPALLRAGAALPLADAALPPAGAALRPAGPALPQVTVLRVDTVLPWAAVRPAGTARPAAGAAVPEVGG